MGNTGQRLSAASESEENFCGDLVSLLGLTGRGGEYDGSGFRSWIFFRGVLNATQSWAGESLEERKEDGVKGAWGGVIPRA